MQPLNIHAIMTRRKYFLLIVALLSAVCGVKAQNVAQAIWCADAKTLYFTYQSAVSVGSKFEGIRIP